MVVSPSATVVTFLVRRSLSACMLGDIGAGRLIHRRVVRDDPPHVERRLRVRDAEVAGADARDVPGYFAVRQVDLTEGEDLGVVDALRAAARGGAEAGSLHTLKYEPAVLPSLSDLANSGMTLLGRPSHMINWTVTPRASAAISASAEGWSAQEYIVIMILEPLGAASNMHCIVRCQRNWSSVVISPWPDGVLGQVVDHSGGHCTGRDLITRLWRVSG